METEVKEQMIKEELDIMSTSHSINTSEADEVVYSYICGILEESMDDVDMLEFISIMEAYIPGFGDVPLEDVTAFMVNLQTRLSETPASDRVSKYSIKQSAHSAPQPLKDTCSSARSKEGGRQRRIRRCSNRKNSESENHSTTQNLTAHTWSGIASPPVSRSISESSTGSHNWPGLVEEEPPVRPRYNSTALSNSPTNSNVSSRTTSECNTNLDHENECILEGASLSQDSVQDECTAVCDSQSQESVLSDPTAAGGDMVTLLTEMFPDKCSLELESCLHQNNNDLETTVVCLLEGEAAFSGRATKFKSRKKSSDNNITVNLSSVATHKNRQRKSQRSRRKSSNSQDESHESEAGMEKLSAAEMKSLIVDKYSYIPTDADSKTYKPKPVTNDEMKMVRYRNGQVVSTKGERFSDVKPAMTDELKTYINLKPAKQYRFH